MSRKNRLALLISVNRKKTAKALSPGKIFRMAVSRQSGRTSVSLRRKLVWRLITSRFRQHPATTVLSSSTELVEVPAQLGCKPTMGSSKGIASLAVKAAACSAVRTKTVAHFAIRSANSLDTSPECATTFPSRLNQ